MKLSQTDLAEKLGVNIRTIINWRRKGLPFTKLKCGSVMFDMQAVTKWLNVKNAKSEEAKQYSKARIHLEVFRAKIAKLEYEERIKEFVLAADVQKARKKCSLRLINVLMKVPDKVVMALDKMTGDKRRDPIEVREMLLEELKTALESL